MNKTEKSWLPPDVMADIQAVADAVANGKRVDPQVAQRVRKRSEEVQEELLRRYGVRELAVDLIRQIRNEE